MQSGNFVFSRVTAGRKTFSILAFNVVLAVNRLWQFFDNFDIFSANATEEKKNCYD